MVVNSTWVKDLVYSFYTLVKENMGYGLYVFFFYP